MEYVIIALIVLAFIGIGITFGVFLHISIGKPDEK